MELEFLREAIRLSIEKMEQGAGGPFGAVVVRDGQIIGRGWNQVTTAKDPTAHAEVMAIRAACELLDTHDLSGCEIYASCEPCPMCFAAIHWARLTRLHFAATSGDAAAAGFDDDVIRAELSKPWHERILPSRQALRDEAVVAFQRGLAKADRIPY